MLLKNADAMKWTRLFCRYTVTLLLLGGLSLSATETSALQAADEKQKVEVRVDGMSCMFCVYSLEKKFSGLEFVDELEINISEGILSFQIPSDAEFSDEDIEKRVKDAGFTPREISREKV